MIDETAYSRKRLFQLWMLRYQAESGSRKMITKAAISELYCFQMNTKGGRND